MTLFVFFVFDNFKLSFINYFLKGEEMRLKRRVDLFKQRGEYDCGPACVKMALDSFLIPRKEAPADYKKICYG